MAGFATQTSFAGHPSRSATAGHALTFNPDHLMGAGHALLPTKNRIESSNKTNRSPHPPSSASRVHTESGNNREFYREFYKIEASGSPETANNGVGVGR